MCIFLLSTECSQKSILEMATRKTWHISKKQRPYRPNSADNTIKPELIKRHTTVATWYSRCIPPWDPGESEISTCVGEHRGSGPAAAVCIFSQSDDVDSRFFTGQSQSAVQSSLAGSLPFIVDNKHRVTITQVLSPVFDTISLPNSQSTPVRQVLSPLSSVRKLRPRHE